MQKWLLRGEKRSEAFCGGEIGGGGGIF